MVYGVEVQQTGPTVAEGKPKESGEGWFTPQSNRATATATTAETRDASSSDGTWFDYFFGSIPAQEEERGNGRDAAEETRDGSASQTESTSGSTDLFGGIMSWLDPAPHVSFSGPNVKSTQRSVPKDSEQVQETSPTFPSEHASVQSPEQKTEEAPSESPAKPFLKEVVEEEKNHNNAIKLKKNRSTSSRHKGERGTRKSKAQRAKKTTQDPSQYSSRDPESHLDGVALAVSEEDHVNDNDSASRTSGASSVVTNQGKMFGDLASLPSVNGETLNMSSSVKTTDLDNAAGMSVRGRNEASVVEEKAKQIKLPKNKEPEAEQRSSKLTGIRLDSRRQLLLQELQSTVATFGQYDIRAASINAALGDLFDESKKHDQAIKMHRDAVDIYSSKLGDDHNTTQDAKLQLGRVLENAERYDEAIGVYFQVTMMRKALRGEKDPSSADSLSRLAAALKKRGDYPQAIKELKRALKVYRESLGDAHEKVSVTVDEIASLYVTLGDFEKASAILEEVVKLKAATKGMKSKAVAATLITLATTYECSEEFNKSMKTLKKAYKIYTDMDGYSSMDATNTLNRIAQLYEATGDNDRASIAYLGVLRGRKINYGEDHLKVAETYFKLGHTLRHSGQQEKALKCMKEALPIFVSKGVEIHDVEMIAEVMHEMALINKDKHRYAESTRIFKQELGVRRKIGQAEFPMIARTLNHLGVTEYEMKNNNRSLKYLIEALTIYKDHAERSVECAEVLFNTGLVFESSRNKDRALDAYNEAARIFREHGYRDNHPHLVKATRKIERLEVLKNGRK